jgi:hypothetical protein
VERSSKTTPSPSERSTPSRPEEPAGEKGAWGAPPPERYEPLPGVLGLPAFAWRRLGRRAQRLAILVAAVLAVAVVVLASQASRLLEESERERRENREEIARRLREDQRPRGAPLPAAADPIATLEREITADVTGRAEAGILTGSAEQTTCERIEPRDVDTNRPIETPGRTYFSCFARTRAQDTTAARLETGYRFRARADEATRTLTWCKLNPRPIHPDQEEFVRLPVSSECVAPARDPATSP